MRPAHASWQAQLDGVHVQRNVIVPKSALRRDVLAHPGMTSSSDEVHRAANAECAAIQNVRVDHGGSDVAVTEQLLHGPDVVAGFEELRGERMAKRMARRTLMHSSDQHRLPERPLDDGGM